MHRRRLRTVTAAQPSTGAIAPERRRSRCLRRERLEQHGVMRRTMCAHHMTTQSSTRPHGHNKSSLEPDGAPFGLTRGGSAMWCAANRVRHLPVLLKPLHAAEHRDRGASGAMPPGARWAR